MPFLGGGGASAEQGRVAGSLGGVVSVWVVWCSRPGSGREMRVERVVVLDEEQEA